MRTSPEKRNPSGSGSREHKKGKVGAWIAAGIVSFNGLLGGCSGAQEGVNTPPSDGVSAAATTEISASTEVLQPTPNANESIDPAQDPIPDQVCYTDPTTKIPETVDNLSKMPRSAIEASDTFAEGPCVEESIPMGFEVNYSSFEGWDEKNEAQKDLAREELYVASGKVNLYIDQLVGGKTPINGVLTEDLSPQEMVQYWAQRAHVVNAVRNDKSDPRNEDIAHKLAEGLVVPGTGDADLLLEDLWNSKDLKQKKTFMFFDEKSLVATGEAKAYTQEDGTVIYPILTEANVVRENDPAAQNGKRITLMAFSPVHHRDDKARIYTETLRLHRTWTKGVHELPDLTFIDIEK